MSVEIMMKEIHHYDLEICRKRMDEMLSLWRGTPYVVYNPYNRPFIELPYVIGFGAGKDGDSMLGYSITEDGYILKEVRVKDESWFWIELGMIVNYSERVQHEYRKHYPDGYKTYFVREIDLAKNKYLLAILQIRQARIEEENRNFPELKKLPSGLGSDRK